MCRSWQEQLGWLSQCEKEHTKGSTEKAPLPLERPEPVDLGNRRPVNKQQLPRAPGLATEGGTTVRLQPVIHAPFQLGGALCLFIQETPAGKVHKLPRTGCWAQLKPWGSLLLHVPLTLACPWPSVSATLTPNCQTSLHVVETLPLCLFTNR